MKSPLVVGCPNLGDRELFAKLVDEVFERRRFTNNGPLVQQLEDQLKTYLGVRHCIPVCNATIGLQIACQALDLKGEVIVPAFTFVATPHSVRWQGLNPVFCDVDRQTHLLDPDRVEACITSETSAILGVHAWGRACYPERLQQIADNHGLQLYFDAAHAFGCGHGGQMIGNFGRCEVFSFHATKFFNSFEGGAIATNDDELAERIRLMINFGFAGTDAVVHLGTNGKMSEIHAAMGLACFESLDEIVHRNRANYECYRSRLDGIPGLRFCDYDSVERSNFQYVVIEIDPSESGFSRDAVMAALHTDEILVRRYFYPGCHQMEPYRSERAAPHLPVTDALCQRTLALPNGSAIGESEVDRVCAALRQVLQR